MAEIKSELECKLVEWDGVDDKENIRNLPLWRRIMIAIILTSCAVATTGNSSVWAIEGDLLQEKFHTTREVINTGVSCFTWAVSLGPLFGGPFSEAFGRRPVCTISMVISFAFQFMPSFGKNLETMIVGRVLSGLFGSVFLCVVPAVIGDLFDPLDLGFYMNICSVGVFLGPAFGPFIGGFALFGGLRWPFHAFTIWYGVAVLMLISLCPETYEPMLLKKKAKRLRKETGDEMIRAKIEIVEKMSLTTKLFFTLKRPIQLFIFEPMMTLLCIYSGFLLSINYFFSIAFPQIYKDIYNFQPYQIGLSFLGLILGMVTAGIWEAIRQRRLAEEMSKQPPESRLLQMIIGSTIVPIGLFMFAWTIYPNVHWIGPIISTFVFGVGSYLTFNTIISYTVAAFKQYSASAVAANVFIRCVMAGAFPMFTLQMLKAMGYHWAMSFIGFIGILLAPSSFLLYKYGPTLREKSEFADS